MNYRIYIGERTYDVTVDEDQLSVNGDRFKIDLESLNGNGLHILRHSNRHIETYLQPYSNGNYDVQIDGKHLCAEVDLGLRSGKKTAEQSSVRGSISSPMPGVIVDILVEEGDFVSEDDPLLVQEAMKMQMKIRTPCSGIIKSIHTHPGDEVDKGKILMVLTPEETGRNGGTR